MNELKFTINLNAFEANPTLADRYQTVCQSLSNEDMAHFYERSVVGDLVQFPADQLAALVAQREWSVQTGKTRLCVWLAPVDGAQPPSHETE
jgi:hypothetical protein